MGKGNIILGLVGITLFAAITPGRTHPPLAYIGLGMAMWITISDTLCIVDKIRKQKWEAQE